MSEPFRNRRAELARLFSHLASGQSTLLTGEARAGKTALLRRLAEPAVRAEHLPDPANLPLTYLDCQALPPDLSAETFWQAVFTSLARQPDLSPKLRQIVTGLLKSGDYDSFALEDCFVGLAGAGSRLALLLDHVDHLLKYPPKTAQALLSNLRGLSSRTGGLALILATRRRLADLNEHTAFLNPRGSPYFNTYIELRLEPLFVVHAT